MQAYQVGGCCQQLGPEIRVAQPGVATEVVGGVCLVVRSECLGQAHERGGESEAWKVSD